MCGYSNRFDGQACRRAKVDKVKSFSCAESLWPWRWFVIIRCLTIFVFLLSTNVKANSDDHFSLDLETLMAIEISVDSKKSTSRLGGFLLG